MNAYEVISGTGAPGSTPAAGGASAAGKADSSNAFAGALEQAMGESEGQDASAAGSGIPAGLLGLPGLPGMLAALSADQSPQDVLNLLSGLSNQLDAVDPNAPLPEDIQDQLAALLMLLQNLLKQPGASGSPTSGEDGGLPAAAATTGALPEQALSPNAQQPVQTLRQVIRQLTERAAGGQTLADSLSALADPVTDALNALQQLPVVRAGSKKDNGAHAGIANAQPASATAVKPSGRGTLFPVEESSSQTAGLHAQTASATAVKPSGQATSFPASQPEESSSQTAGFQADIRKAAAPLRNPVWQFQAVQPAEADTTAAAASAATAEISETPGLDESAPVWTFLKGDNAAIPAAVPTHAAAPAQVPVAEFAEQIGKYLVKQFILTHGNGSAEAKISLHPEHLGQVDIKIMLQNGQLTAQFMTESGVARDLLENQMSQLRTTLQGQGLQVDRMEVVQMSSSSATASFFHQNAGRHGSGQNGDSSKGRGSRAGYEDAAGFEAELDRTAYLREIGYGSSLNVTA